MSNNLVLRNDHGPIAVLTLNRPEKRNALSQALIAELSDQLDRLASEPSVRVLVLTGAGSAFCAGMDLKEAFAPVADAEAERRAVAEVKALADLIDQVHAWPKPTLAAINGDALAGGAGLAMACDLALIADTARIGYPEVFRGLVPAIVSYDLVRLVGQRRARQLLLAGQSVTAPEALQWGLVNDFVTAEQLVPRALALAETLCQGGPRAQTTLKQILDDASGRPKSLRQAAAVTAAVRVSDEAREGIAAFLEKRNPRWS